MTKRKTTGNGGAEATVRNAEIDAQKEALRHGPPPSEQWLEEDKRARARGPGNRGRRLGSPKGYGRSPNMKGPSVKVGDWGHTLDD